MKINFINMNMNHGNAMYVCVVGTNTGSGGGGGGDGCRSDGRSDSDRKSDGGIDSESGATIIKDKDRNDHSAFWAAGNNVVKSIMFVCQILGKHGVSIGIKCIQPVKY